MLKTIKFEIETTTPMFLSGADQGKAELRAASIKGLMRFWWRALQAESELDKLRDRENRIFGSADEKKGGGSGFAIRIVESGGLKRTTADLPKYNITVTSKSKGKSFPVNILEYLAYGPCTYDKTKKKNVIVREYIQHDSKFTIYMNIFREDCLKELLKTMYVFDLFGGIGSKSRNGFGGFYIKNREECFDLISSDFSIKDKYKKENLHNFIRSADDKKYSSFTKRTKLFRTRGSYSTWDKALGEAGKIYRGIRSGDFKIIDSDGNQRTFEKHFKYDKRQYIASPIIVNKKEKSFLDRHAKPYFIKVAREGNQYRSYILYLPSLYCEGLEKNNQNKLINHSETNKKFKEVCSEFNEFLSQNMETVL